MDTISATTDKWVPVENERAAKKGCVLWVKPGKYGQLHCLTPEHCPPPDEGKGGLCNLDILFYLLERGLYVLR